MSLAKHEITRTFTKDGRLYQIAPARWLWAFNGYQGRARG